MVWIKISMCKIGNFLHASSIKIRYSSSTRHVRNNHFSSECVLKSARFMLMTGSVQSWLLVCASFRKKAYMMVETTDPTSAKSHCQTLENKGKQDVSFSNVSFVILPYGHYQQLPVPSLHARNFLEYQL